MSTINLKGHIQTIQTVTGHISKGKTITGTISKPSPHGKSDHVFVIVDLLKMQVQSLAVNSGNVTVPFTATNTQSASGQFSVDFVSTSITVNEEVYSNANP